jgi:hypothetical protein
LITLNAVSGAIDVVDGLGSGYLSFAAGVFLLAGFPPILGASQVTNGLDYDSLDRVNYSTNQQSVQSDGESAHESIEIQAQHSH